MKIRLIVSFFALCLCLQGLACTSVLVPSCKSASGRPLMWKHRDAGVLDNFLQRVDADSVAGHFGYVALFNAGDSALAEAWMGMNDAGFSIMNTASYNVPQYTGPEDQEGIVMTAALRQCASLDDFARLLDAWPKPAGIMANFGVMDSAGNMAYFEADDFGYKVFPVTDSVVVRTNYSMSAPKKGGKGFERYCDVYDLMGSEFERGAITPSHFIDSLSCSFWNSKKGIDYADGHHALAPDDGNMIPRFISTASIVIEGGADPQMHAVLGFPPCGEKEIVRLDSVPSSLLPGSGFKGCANSLKANARKKALTIRKKGTRYFKMNRLRKPNR